MESVISGHKFNQIRERLADKLEIIRFDPWSEYTWIKEILHSKIKWTFLSATGISFYYLDDILSAKIKDLYFILDEI